MTALVIERAGHAVVQDLGRPGWGSLGIAANGAADAHAARVANLLAGNPEQAPLIEITGSELAFRASRDVLVAATGAATTVMVDGYPQPAWETLVVAAGAQVVVPLQSGFRSYVAVNGDLEASVALGSVAPDALLAPVTLLTPGHRLEVRTRYDARADGPHGPLGRLFRLGAVRPDTSPTARVRVTPGPDLGRLRGGADALRGGFRVLPQSDHVGLRLAGAGVELVPGPEILSRGVPIGAVEVTPSGDTIVLLRGRLVTAGYPVVAVVTSEALDRLGQVRPGDEIRFELCDVATAREQLRARSNERAALAERVRTAFYASGLGRALAT